MRFLNGLLCFLILGNCFSSFGQTPKATNDLQFLLGDWKVTRTYGPDSDLERTYLGTLSCVWDLDSTFIACTYVLERPGKKKGMDRVYFNYNGIYDQYESTWMSSTWPIKATSSGDLTKGTEKWTLSTRAEFLIQNGVTEFVKTDWQIFSLGGAFKISRETFIRTSNDPDGYWHHHMNESLIHSEPNAE